MSVPSPIADLSYRNYDGPKSLSKWRWWAIAKSAIKINLKKKSFWPLFFFACFPYILLVMQQLFPREVMTAMSDRFSYSAMLSSAFGTWLWVFFIALMIGVGSIAADNAANALQIYLSKPITKRDYVFGKWMGIFIPLYAVVFIPMFLSIGYSAFSEGVTEFMSANMRAMMAVFVVPAIPAALHASLLVGISAWNRTPWIAGIIYAGIVFFTNTAANLFAEIMGSDLDRQVQETISHLSIDGVISGIGYGIIGSPPSGINFQGSLKEMPLIEPLIPIYLILCMCGIWLGFKRIRAVEVVS